MEIGPPGLMLEITHLSIFDQIPPLGIMASTLHADVSAILVIGVVQENIMVPRFPGALLFPLCELGFVPDYVVFRAALTRLGSDFPPTRRLSEGPDVCVPGCFGVAKGAA
eukprot:11715994-Heterocapsa_arctica.AAC.1